MQQLLKLLLREMSVTAQTVIQHQMMSQKSTATHCQADSSTKRSSSFAFSRYALSASPQPQQRTSHCWILHVGPSIDRLAHTTSSERHVLYRGSLCMSILTSSWQNQTEGFYILHSEFPMVIDSAPCTGCGGIFDEGSEYG